MKIMPKIINYDFYDASLIYGDVPTTNLRRTSMYEFEYITEDGGKSYIEDRVFPIRKGGIILAKPGQLRHTDLPYKCLYVHAVIEDCELCSLLDPLPSFFMPSDPDSFDAAFRAFIYKTKFPKKENNIDIAIKFLEILSLFIKAPLSAEAGRSDSNRSIESVHKAISFIDKNYTKNISLDDIASHVHLSKIYFHNLFLRSTGQTPHEYILSKRINNVKFLLTATDKSFSDIAYDCGFSSHAYMTYAFKKRMSLTPMQYKKKLTNSKSSG